MKFNGFLSAFALVAGLSLVLSAGRRPEADGHIALRQGAVLPYPAERIDASHLSSSQGETKTYVLVHFWASYDGESRAENALWHSREAQLAAHGISYQAVSMDEDAYIWQETLRLDGIRDEAQRLARADEREDIRLSCGLSEGYHSYLIDELGVVVSIDPKPEDLEKFYQTSI